MSASDYLIVRRDSNNGSLFSNQNRDREWDCHRVSLNFVFDRFGWNNWECYKFPSNQSEQPDHIPNAFYTQKVGLDGALGDILCPYVNSSYEVIQYSGYRTFLETYLEEGILDISSALNLGDVRSAITCDIALKPLSVVENDRLYNKLIVSLAHDRSVRSVHFATFDAVCENTLHAGQMIAFRNNKAFELKKQSDLKTAKGLIDFCNGTFAKTVDRFKSLDSIVLDMEQVSNITKTLFHLPKTLDMDKLLDTDKDDLSKSQQKYFSVLESLHSESNQVRFGEPTELVTGYHYYNALTDAMKPYNRGFFAELVSGERLRSNAVNLLEELVVA